MTFADATDIEVEDGQPVALDDLEIGGRPGSIAGEVVAADPTGAVARLVVPGVGRRPDTTALVDEVPVSADGSFLFEDVPSPANYQLVVDKPGFATEVRDVVLQRRPGAGGHRGRAARGRRRRRRAGAEPGRTARRGDDRRPRTATIEVSTVSLTLDDVGSFAVRTLPTPGQYTLTFEREGYDPATRTVDLAAAQQLPGLAVTLAPATGSIAGTVSQDDVGPVGGVTVTVSGPDVEASTTTASLGNVGAYVFEDLPVPATYTLTFTKDRSGEPDPPGGARAVGRPGLGERHRRHARAAARPSCGAPCATSTDDAGRRRHRRPHRRHQQPAAALGPRPARPLRVRRRAARRLHADRQPAGHVPGGPLVNVVAAEVRELDIRLERRRRSEGWSSSAIRSRGGATRTSAPPCACSSPPTSPTAAREATTTTGLNGRYTFSSLEAPADFVVAVYDTPTSANPLEIQRARREASTAVDVNFQIPSCAP